MTDKQKQPEMAGNTDRATATPEDLLPEQAPGQASEQTPELESRRAFLFGLGKWSKAVIVGAIAGGALLPGREAQAGWINRRGGGGVGWINGGSGVGWGNRRGGGWGGGSWINRR